MNQSLRLELLAMQAEDIQARRHVADHGILGDLYEPRLEGVHQRNAARLEEIVRAYGWPGRSLVGDDGAEAAWLALQQAISRPDLLRGYLPLLKQAAARGEIPNWQPAYIVDRIRFFEGNPQVYGTHYDWDADGLTRRWPIEDAEHVNERRKKVELPPLVEPAARTRVQQPMTEQQIKAHREAVAAWARAVGWRE